MPLVFHPERTCLGVSVTAPLICKRLAVPHLTALFRLVSAVLLAQLSRYILATYYRFSVCISRSPPELPHVSLGPKRSTFYYGSEKRKASKGIIYRA